MRGKLHFAPLKNPKRILDLGTGTGIWAIDAGTYACRSTLFVIDTDAKNKAISIPMQM